MGATAELGGCVPCVCAQHGQLLLAVHSSAVLLFAVCVLHAGGQQQQEFWDEEEAAAARTRMERAERHAVIASLLDEQQ